MYWRRIRQNLFGIESEFVKILFKIIDEDSKDQWTETVWAEPLSNSEYTIQNSPFHARGVSYLDTIRTEGEFNGIPLFKEVIQKSGNSTYRIIVFKEITNPLFEQFWKPLQDQGCSFESANPKLISVNVPSQSDINQVYKLLEGGEKLGIWDFEEADCSHQA